MSFWKWVEMRWTGFWQIFYEKDAAANPEVHYAALANEFRERAQKHTEALGRLKGQRNIQQTKLAAAELALKKAEQKLKQALAMGEAGKAIGTRALAEKQNSMALVESLKAIITRLSEEYSAGVLQGKQIRRDYEARTARAAINITRLRSHEAAMTALSAFDSMSVDDLARGYSRVDEAIEQRIGTFEAQREIAGESVEALKADAAAEQGMVDDEWSRLLADQQRQQGVSSAAAPATDAYDVKKV